MTTLIDALSARTQFGRIMNEAEKKNVRFLVSRRGRPKVVILGVEDYLKNIIKQPKLITKVQISAREAGLDRIRDAEIEAEIKAFRKTGKKRTRAAK
ncbi:MAG: type II toxin-antitoxin system Phd/YefM family antitoxin [Deltaproteobacteria bacterium]|jgi:prevent-host-death family protein|nr:type II toxin-antitoxin system Phd/YefM family antitoxin [Deltaproteobacteria bacterium]